MNYTLNITMNLKALLIAGAILSACVLSAETINYSSGTNVRNSDVESKSTINLSGGNNTFNAKIDKQSDVNINGGVNIFNDVLEEKTDLVITGGDTTFNEAIKKQSTITVTDGTVIFQEKIEEKAEIVISGGTFELNNTLEKQSDIVISGGSLLVGSNDAFKEKVDIELGGGSLLTQGNDLDVRNLTLTGNSVIDLGVGSGNIDLGKLRGFDSGYTLTFLNYSDDDSINFGNNQTGLSTQQLESQIFFGSLQGSITGNIIEPGDIAPVPEPSTWIGIVLVLVFVLYRERRRFLG